MKQFWIGLVSLFFMSAVQADPNIEALLNKVSFQLSAEQWVSSKTALVTVSINAAVNDMGLDKIQSHVLEKLNKVANSSDWHLISYDRAQDKSGLESIQIMAQARLLTTDMVGLRDKTKSMSKAGETFAIDTIQFTPSDEELREANNALRENVYDQIKAELARLNKAYPEQKYYLHEVNFINPMLPMPVMYLKTAENANASIARNATPLAVGDKLRISAVVILSTVPEQNMLKAIHN